jgi:uncharacterized membrane protein
MPERDISDTNVGRIIRLEEETEHERQLADRIADAIVRFTGTVWFVAVVLGCCGVWIAANLRRPAFDPYPFGLLGMILALVSLVLTSLVLIRQNHMSRRADLRNHLALQINLLAEQEGTKILQVLQKLSEHLGIAEEVVDSAATELAGDTSIERIAENLRETIDESGMAKSAGDDGRDEEGKRVSAAASESQRS